jgi:multidrug resistance protein
MFAPAVPQLMAEFHSTNNELAAFVVSVYLIGYATGPLVIAPLSELYGRLYVYHINNVLFIIFTIACAVSPSLSALIGFRFLAGCAGSCPVTLGGGTVADVIHPGSRGLAMSLYILGMLLGPVMGPVAGGFFAQAEGWRWIFWLLAIAVRQSLIILLSPPNYEDNTNKARSQVSLL